MLSPQRTSWSWRPGSRGQDLPARSIAELDLLAACRRTHPAADLAQVAHLAAATGQWSRIVGQRPRARLAQPSRAVEQVWAALGGRDIPWARVRTLGTTYLLACADEGAHPPHLPMVFRVDWVLDRLDGCTYVPNCGEVRYCAAPAGTVCLGHVLRPPRRRTTWRGPLAGGFRDPLVSDLRLRP